MYPWCVTYSPHNCALKERNILFYYRKKKWYKDIISPMASVKKQNFQGEVYSTGGNFYFWLPLTVLSSAPAMQQGPWVADRSGEMNDGQTSWRVSLRRVCLLFPCQPRASLTQRQQTAEDMGHFIQPSFWFFLVPSQHDMKSDSISKAF